jgi:hypothetical protein
MYNMLLTKTGGTTVTSIHTRQHGVIFYITVDYLIEGLKINHDYFLLCVELKISEIYEPLFFLQYYEYTDQVRVHLLLALRKLRVTSDAGYIQYLMEDINGQSYELYVDKRIVLGHFQLLADEPRSMKQLSVCTS